MTRSPVVSSVSEGRKDPELGFAHVESELPYKGDPEMAEPPFLILAPSPLPQRWHRDDQCMCVELT